MHLFQSKIEGNAEKLANIKPYIKTFCPLENPNYILVDNQCYYIQTNTTNYETAKEKCKENLADYGGGRLFQPRSRAQNELIMRLAHESTGKSQWFWLGVTDNTKEGEFTYSGNDVPINFDPDWDSGYGSRGTSYNCILSYMDGGSSSSFSKWLDYDCSSQYGSICESSAELQSMKVNKSHNKKTEHLQNQTNKAYLSEGN